MSTLTPKKYWFIAKTYGYGWTPASWQGWVLTLSYVGSIVIAGWRFSNTAALGRTSISHFAPLLLATLVYFWIVIKTGERPRWQWGPKKDVQK